MPVTSLGYNVTKQPIAQSFFIDEPKGIYATKVDLFFATRDDPTTTKLPVRIDLRPMVNGVPSSSKILPGSTVVKAAADVIPDTSGPALTATTFTFEEPVFLKGLEDFALVVTADSKDYSVYIAEIDEFQFGSTERRVNKQPTSGSLFYTSNGVTFTPAQNQDLTFRLHRASFKHTTGTVSLKNAVVPKAHLLDPPITTRATNTANEIFVKHINHGLQVGSGVTLSNVDSTGVGGIFASTLNKKHTVTKVDWSGYAFLADSDADSAVRGGGGAVLATKNIPYSIIVPNIELLQPIDTHVTAAMKGTTGKSFAGGETPFQKDPNFDPIKIGENNYSRKAYLVVNDSDETVELAAETSTKSLEFQVTFTRPEADSNISPMIDMQRTSATLFDNVIDKQDSAATVGFNVPLNFVNEIKPNGSAAAKHLTKVINLANDAVGLKVLINANKPNGTDFELYFRTATADEEIATKDYALASIEQTVPNTDNAAIFRQHSFLIGGQNGSLPSFTKFQLKIVFRSTNRARVPQLSSLRAIALSV